MTKQIQAAVFRTAGAAPVLERITIDEPRADEVRVSIKAVGICHTDMVLRDQLLPLPLPAVLGHEGAGVVEAVGADVTSVVPGDHVVLSFSSCGHCPSCHDHAPAYCHDWFGLNFAGARADGSVSLKDGNGAPVHSHVFGQSSFATSSVVPERNVVKVDKELPLQLLGPLGCGIQTGAGTVLKTLRPRPGSSIAVMGAGAVGISAIMGAAIAGVATVVAIDLNPDRVALAREVGATHGFLASEGSVLSLAAQAGCPGGFDYIVDTTGNVGVVNEAILGLAPRGELAMVGAYPPMNVTADATFVMSGGRVIRGVVEGGGDPQTFIPELISYYEKGQFPFDRLVEYFRFEDIAEAIEAGESGRVVKPIVVMEA